MSTDIITPPNPVPQNLLWKPSVFLAGSIEMGRAELWQDWVIEGLRGMEITICNPRRSDYDPKAAPVMSNPYFKGQVDWETEYLERVSTIAFYFAPTANSIISMHELGAAAERNKPFRTRYASWPTHRQSILVYCPDEYIRCGNVEHTCQRFNISVYKDRNDWLNALRTNLIAQTL